MRGLCARVTPSPGTHFLSKLVYKNKERWTLKFLNWFGLVEKPQGVKLFLATACRNRDSLVIPSSLTRKFTPLSLTKTHIQHGAHQSARTDRSRIEQWLLWSGRESKEKDEEKLQLYDENLVQG
jgi:hypothetical protein